MPRAMQACLTNTGRGSSQSFVTSAFYLSREDKRQVSRMRHTARKEVQQGKDDRDSTAMYLERSSTAPRYTATDGYTGSSSPLDPPAASRVNSTQADLSSLSIPKASAQHDVQVETSSSGPIN